MRAVALSLTLAVLYAETTLAGDPPASPFKTRGYYFTFSRMPTYGLDAWKKIMDCVQADGGNTVVLWIGGGFRSRRFPETWAYNRDHANVRADFVRALIDDAHAKKIAVLLGLTPFGYDGVNQMTANRSEWRATGPDGLPCARFGFQSWGTNLCPSREDAARFMTEYARELCLEFYPQADGLLVESSDYAVCHCKDCGARFYDREFEFTNALSKDLWAKNPAAVVAVYPHYFTGAAVPGLEVTGARHSFDPRWTLFYTPHSAPPAAALTRKASGAIWSDDAVARRTPSDIREAARRARREGCTGYVPSLEVFNYVPSEPEEGQAYHVGKRLRPLGFGWLKEDQPPYDELPARVNRIAYREYAKDPDLSESAFRDILGKELFGAASTAQAVEDALRLQQAFAVGRTWCYPAPAVSPERVRALKAAGKLDERTRAECRTTLGAVRDIEKRHRGARPEFAELHRIAAWVAEQWTPDSLELLTP